jgi:hypothetical protein
MVATLYLPQHSQQVTSTEGLKLPAPPNYYAFVTEKVAALLGCTQEQVDVLDSGADYVAYSIFDSEGELNPEASLALATVSSNSFNLADEGRYLRGPILILTRS